MALVDQLEAQLAASRAAAEKLMEAVVAELTAAGAPAVKPAHDTVAEEAGQAPTTLAANAS